MLRPSVRHYSFGKASSTFAGGFSTSPILAMGSTDREGYLRLGECLRGVGEMENAHGSFEIAALEAERGNGRPEAGEYARRMMAELDGTF